MQISFMDFELLGASATASPERAIDGAVSRMNSWVAEHQINVVNVETLSDGSSYAPYGVRCWYRQEAV